MDYFIVAAVISAIVVLVLSIAILRQPARKKDATARPRPVEQREGGPRRGQVVRNQRAVMRANGQYRRNAARHHQELAEEDAGVDDAAAEEGAPGAPRNIDFEDKMGAKKRAKLEAKAEKKAAREAEQHIREDRKKKELQQEEERRKKEEKEEAEEKKRVEEERQAEEEKQKREEEEYRAMRAAFTVEGEGFDEEEAGSEENLLQEFKDYIQAQKVVLLEDLAAHFKLKTQAVIDRIAALQADGELTGVVDDRGKFIYISQKELEDVVKFIKQRGRVSIVELAESSNKLINLNPVSV